MHSYEAAAGIGEILGGAADDAVEHATGEFVIFVYPQSALDDAHYAARKLHIRFFAPNVITDFDEKVQNAVGRWNFQNMNSGVVAKLNTDVVATFPIRFYEDEPAKIGD